MRARIGRAAILGNNQSVSGKSTRSRIAGDELQSGKAAAAQPRVWKRQDTRTVLAGDSRWNPAGEQPEGIGRRMPVPHTSSGYGRGIQGVLLLCVGGQAVPTREYLCEYHDRICRKQGQRGWKAGLWAKSGQTFDETAERAVSYAANLILRRQSVRLRKYVCAVPEIPLVLFDSL